MTLAGTSAGWTAILQILIETGGFFGIGAALFMNARARRAANLIQLTQQHRDLWERIYLQPELSRILRPTVDLEKAPVTAEEELFVIFLILHLGNSFYVSRSGFHLPRGIRKDVEYLFALPIPYAVWRKVRDLQDEDFVRFVERCLPIETD